MDAAAGNLSGRFGRRPRLPARADAPLTKAGRLRRPGLVARDEAIATGRRPAAVVGTERDEHRVRRAGPGRRPVGGRDARPA